MASASSLLWSCCLNKCYRSHTVLTICCHHLNVTIESEQISQPPWGYMSPPRIEKPLICLHSFLPKTDFTGFDDLSGFTGGRSHTVLTIVATILTLRSNSNRYLSHPGVKPKLGSDLEANLNRPWIDPASTTVHPHPQCIRSHFGSSIN